MSATTPPHAPRNRFLTLVALALGLWPARAHATTGAAPDSASPAPPAAIAPPRLGGYAQFRETAQERVGLTASFARARFSVAGTLPSSFRYKLLTELFASASARNPASVSLREAFIEWAPGPVTVTAGEFKVPMAYEYILSSSRLEFSGFSAVVDSLAPKYDLGVQAEHRLGERATIALGVFNGEGANAGVNRDSMVLVAARATLRPVPDVTLGLSGTRDGADSLRWGADGIARYGRLRARAEYLTRHVRGRERSQDDRGWTAMGAARLAPKLELAVRQDDFRRPAAGPAYRARGTSVAANVDVVPDHVRLLFEFTRRIRGLEQKRSDVVLGQLQIQF